MTYDEMVLELTQKKKERRELDTQISDSRRDVDRVNLEVDRHRSTVDRILIDKEQQAKTDAEREALAPLERNLRRTEERITDLMMEYQSAVDSVRDEDILSELREKVISTEKISKTLEKVKGTLKENLGERVFEEYRNQVANYKVALPEEELHKLINKFSLIEEDVERMSTKSSNIVDKFTETVDNLISKQLPNTKQGAAKLAGIGSGAVALLTVVAFPFYITFLATRFVGNIRKNTVYSQTIMLCNMLEDNLEEIDKKLHDDVVKEREKIMEKIKQSFLEEKLSLEKERDSLEEDLETTESGLANSFVFDDIAVRQELEMPRKELDSKKSFLLHRLKEMEERKLSVESRILKLEEDIRNIVESIKEEYLSYEPGTEMVLNPRFLFDIKGNTPEFFDHPLKSMFVLYEERDDAEKFAQLIITQLRAKLSASVLINQIWDVGMMGAAFGTYYEENKHLVKVSRDPETSLDFLEDLRDQIEARLELFKERKDLSDYNEFMVSISSVSETYYFLFIIEPEVGLIDDHRFKQLLELGAKVGIFPMIFVSQENFGEDWVEWIKKSGASYELSFDGIKKRARQAMLNRSTALG